MKKVLIVDPNKDFTNQFYISLKKKKIAALIANSVQDAMSILNRGEPLIAITISPELHDSSYGEFIRSIRDLKHYSITPVYLLSGLVTRDVVRHGFEQNATEIYSKNNLAKLISVIQHKSTIKKIQGTVLYLEDSVSEAMDVCMTLRQSGLDVIMHDNVIAGLRELNSSQVDLALTGLTLKDEETGIDFIRKVRNLDNDHLCTLPIMVLTSFKNISAQIESYNAGADDYLVKPLLPAELISKIARQIDKRKTKRTLEYRQKLFEKMAIYDALSGLYNRHGTHELAKRLLFAAKRNQRNLTIMVLDLDNFKQVNDSKGHIFGDKVIKLISEILQQHVRANDIAGRWGGDEFILLFEECNTVLAEQIAKRIILEVSEVCLEQKLGVSIGICQYAPDLHKEFEDLFDMADHGLYEAKKAGKNGYFVVNKEPTKTSQNEITNPVTYIGKKRKS